MDPEYAGDNRRHAVGMRPDAGRLDRSPIARLGGSACGLPSDPGAQGQGLSAPPDPRLLSVMELSSRWAPFIPKH